MSIGLGGWCKMIEQDENTIIYQYGAYNLNEPQFRNEEHLQDGWFIIHKDSLVEPESRRKLKRFPHGKKKEIIKRIVMPVPYEELYEKGSIQIQDCSHCWKTSFGAKDYIAWHLINKVFFNYQEEGSLPEQISYDV